MLQATAEIIEGMQQRDTDGAVVELSPLTSASGLAFAYVFMFLVGDARRRCQTLLDRNYWETVKEQRGREQDQPDSGCVVVNSDLSGLQTPVRPAAGINPVTWGKS